MVLQPETKTAKNEEIGHFLFVKHDFLPDRGDLGAQADGSRYHHTEYDRFRVVGRDRGQRFDPAGRIRQAPQPTRSWKTSAFARSAPTRPYSSSRPRPDAMTL